MTFFFACQLATCFFPSAASAQDEQDIVRLIKQLGSNEHAIRSEADEKLLAIGGPAIPLLRKSVALKGPVQPDSEIRMRCTRLLILIERAEYEKKIEEFLEGKLETIDLAGWPEFSAIVGNEKVSRQLFIAMHEAQPDLMNAIDETREDLEEQHQNVVRRRMYISNYGNANQVLGTIASVAFVASLERPSANGANARISISDYNMTRIRSVLVQPQMSRFIGGTSQKKQMDELVVRWLTGFPNTDGKLLMTKLEIIKAMKLSTELPLALRIANNPAKNKSARIYSLRILESMGGETLVPQLEQAFENQEILGQYLVMNPSSKNKEQKQSSSTLEVRFCDLALAVAIKLRGLDPSDYGFDKAAFSNGAFVINRAGFRSEEERKRAFSNWKATMNHGN